MLLATSLTGGRMLMFALLGDKATPSINRRIHRVACSTTFMSAHRHSQSRHWFFPRKSSGNELQYNIMCAPSRKLWLPGSMWNDFLGGGDTRETRRSWVGAFEMFSLHC